MVQETYGYYDGAFLEGAQDAKANDERKEKEKQKQAT